MKSKTFLEFKDRNRTLKILRTKRELEYIIGIKLKSIYFF